MSCRAGPCFVPRDGREERHTHRANESVSLVHRALPGWCVDLVRDGVHPADLNDRAVWAALGRTALSAQECGLGWIDWEYLLDVSTSRLARQAQQRHGKPRSQRAVRQSYEAAWERAWERRTQQPAWDHQQIATEAETRAAAATSLAANPDAD